MFHVGENLILIISIEMIVVAELLLCTVWHLLVDHNKVH